MTYFVKTFGCQMNARDSEKLVGILEQIGYVEGTDEHSDLLYTTPVPYVRMLTTRCTAGLGICRITRKESSDEDCSLRLHDAGAGGC